MQYAVILEKEPTSDWGAYVPDLPGCVAVAKTREEVNRLIREAIVFPLRGLGEDGGPVPQPTSFALNIALEVFNG